MPMATHTRIASAEMTTNAIIERDEFGRFVSEIERSGSRLMEDLGNKLERRARTLRAHANRTP
jgi:hypothetical protein